jgi:hypothetical protein
LSRVVAGRSDPGRPTKVLGALNKLFYRGLDNRRFAKAQKRCRVGHVTKM